MPSVSFRGSNEEIQTGRRVQLERCSTAFSAALKSAMNTPHKPLKEKPKIEAAKKKKAAKKTVR
jgi:hypothetical protein